MKSLFVFALLACVVAISQTALCQACGEIAGRIVDARSGEPLYLANVVLVGTELGGATDSSGFYRVTRIPPGTYCLTISCIGYDRDTLQSYTAQAGRIDTINLRIFPCGTRQAREDLAKGKAQILILGLTIRSLPEETENRLTRKYGFTYNYDDSIGPCTYGYDQTVHEYLEKLNGSGWYARFRHELDSLVQTTESPADGK